MGELESSWGVQPGDIRSRVDGVEWLLRSSMGYLQSLLRILWIVVQ